MKQLLMLAACLITFMPCTAQEVDKLLAESNPAIQSQLQAIDRVFRPVDGLSNNVEALREIQKLKELTDDKAELVKQVAIFSVAPGPETQPMTAGAILYYLQVPSGDTIRALAPYLDTKNPQLRSFVLDWFHGHDKADHGEWAPVNYTDYLGYVSWKMNRGEDIPTPFIRYIYERSPGRALLVFANGTVDVSARLRALRAGVEARQQGRELTDEERAGAQKVQETGQREGQERREILLAEHIISNALWLKKRGFDERFQAALPEAMAELEKLAKHDEWWARLYVVYTMRQNLVLRKDVVLRQLAEDENELVREEASKRGNRSR